MNHIFYITFSDNCFVEFLFLMKKPILTSNFSYFNSWRKAVQTLTDFYLIVPLVYMKPHNLFFVLPRFSLVYLNRSR